MARVRLVRSTSRGPSFESGNDRTGFSSPSDHPSPRSTWSWSCSDAWTCLRLTMKVWAITLDVSTLNSTAFETVREHWHVYLLSFGLCFALTSPFPPPPCSIQYYARGLQFVDEPARTKIKKFFRREDAFSGFLFFPPLLISFFFFFNPPRTT